MKHAEICPICKGRGRVPEDPEWDSGPSPSTRVCHGCNGKGWVEVEGEYRRPDADKIWRRPIPGYAKPQWTPTTTNPDPVTITTTYPPNGTAMTGGYDTPRVRPASEVYSDADASSNTLHTCVKINPEYLAGQIHG